ncbi:MAG: receptor [Cyclobacteriaceae bacterium]|nr:receptor [Cyclobacteriaceae bacterium]MDW8332437.1 7TM diverse intracellular signaling domain-containing protein [Cyclobacteriaceae bacterium]
MKSRAVFFYHLLIWMGSLVFAAAQAPYALRDEEEEQNIMPNEQFIFIDTTGSLTLEEILHSGTYTFQQQSKYHNTDFQKNASYWIRLPVRHTASTKKIWLLEFYDQTIDYIHAYLPQENGSYEVTCLGDQHPFSERLFRHKNFELLIDTRKDTVLVYYFKVQSHEFADLRIALRSVNRFVYYALNEYLLFGTFYGMIIIIALYNFLVYLAIREIKNIYYICYILSVAGYALSLDGIGFQYLWPKHPEWNNYATGVFLYLLIFWSLVFTRKFLSTRALAPRLDRVLKITIVMRSAYFLILLVFFPDLLPYRNPDIIPLALIFYTGVRVWRNGYKPARFFVIAYGILFGGFFIRMLVYFNILPFTTISHYSLHFAFVLEMLFLTFALGDRIRILKDMRDRALRRIIQQHELNMQLKDKVNRELETKVMERTRELDQKNHELEVSNQKLKEQADKLNRINSMLDLDNWKLKNAIKEVLNERFQEKIMDYDQFKTLFPDKLACYRFLEELKWSDGYRCKKCGNEKYFTGLVKFSRRCTRCGYNESITAYTIFHSLKFPIDKAFYIAYLTVTGWKDQTIDEVAEKLQVSAHSVWAFKMKVTEKISELQQKGRQTTHANWSNVILLTHSRKASRKKEHQQA